MAACSPALNWRSFSASESGFKAVFPGKPQTQTRAIAWGPTTMRMTVTAAGQGPSLFAVIVSERPRGQEQAVLHFLRDALLKNARMAPMAQPRVPALPPAARARAEFALSVRAQQALAAGASTQPAQLAAQLLVVGERVYQIVALTGPHFPETELEAFFGAFELI